MDVFTTRVRLLAIPVMIAAFAGCQRTPKPVSQVPPPRLPARPPLVWPTKSDRENLPAIIRANNAFALALYQRLRTGPGNLLVSPACLSAGLALIHAGAEGETARQIALVLHLPAGLAAADRAYAALIQDLSALARDRSYQIRSANAVWIKEGYSLLDSYRATLKDVFALDGDRVGFPGRPEEACRLINAWTESQTGGKIGGMLRPADLPARTRLILTNALDFRANWKQKFERERTVQAAFHVAPDETIDVPMMNDHSHVIVHGYYDGGSFQALELPLGSGGEFAMVVLLPRKHDALADLEATLKPETLDSWQPRFRRPEEIIIALPKYRIRAEATLNRPLAELGMSLAFEPEADFSGMNGKSHDLFLHAARHATFLDVNEEGIEAASAMDAPFPDAFGEEPPVFRADHPFVFLIRDTRSGCILFVGRVVNPLEQTYEMSISKKGR